MKMNAGAWIGIIGGLAGFIIALVAVITTTGEYAWYIAAGMIIVFGGMMFLFYKLLFAPMILAARLRKNGIPGMAVIKEVHDTGVTINNNPQVKLLLDVKNNYGQLSTVTLRTLVSRIYPGMYQPGMTVPVLIDPENEQRLIIDTESMSPPSPLPSQPVPSSFSSQQINDMKHDIEKISLIEKQLLISGISARAIVKHYQWLGANVNGNNPFVELTLEILPDNAPAFEAKTKGVISENAVNRYQPGSEVYVKYDAADKSRVILHHS